MHLDGARQTGRRLGGAGLRRLPAPLLVALLRSSRISDGTFDRVVAAAGLDERMEQHPYSFTRGLTTGATYQGTTGDLIDRAIAFRGIWEPNITAFFRRRLRPGDVVIDIGANSGYYSLLSAPLVGEAGLVVAVEASPTVFAKLTRNLTRNGFVQIEAVNVAAGRTHGKLPFYRATAATAGKSSLVRSNIDVESVAEGVVDVVPAAELLPKDRLGDIRLVKIDVEGFEAEVVAGLVPVLDQLTQAEILVEINPAQDELDPTAVFDVFEQRSFHPYVVENPYWPLSARSCASSEPPRRMQERPTSLADVIFSREDSAYLL